MAHLLIIDARFYEALADEMVKGATAALEAAGSTYERVSVPGALEIPAAIAYAIETGKYDGYVALGCVIKGETDHYEHVCRETMNGLTLLAIHKLASIGNGILTVQTMEHAVQRSSTTGGNKGAVAALAALAMIGVRRKLGISGR